MSPVSVAIPSPFCIFCPSVFIFLKEIFWYSLRRNSISSRPEMVMFWWDLMRAFIEVLFFNDNEVMSLSVWSVVMSQVKRLSTVFR